MQSLFQSIQFDVDLGIASTLPKISLRIMFIFMLHKFSGLNPFHNCYFCRTIRRDLNKWCFLSIRGTPLIGLSGPVLQEALPSSCKSGWKLLFCVALSLFLGYVSCTVWAQNCGTVLLIPGLLASRTASAHYKHQVHLYINEQINREEIWHQTEKGFKGILRDPAMGRVDRL